MSAITGIGASILPSPAGGFEISSLSATGNARLHLQVGDRIMSIGSVATSGKTDVEVKNLILGPAGSTISMVCAAPCSCLAPMAQLTFAN
jgi:C-terminal processing protease CtpA/Prc